ncbi:MAG TPA: hypothetical protein DEH25_16130 [Chloroflexi bacterium]|nr:hypothetical protein [Chloroflexota bacterium]
MDKFGLITNNKAKISNYAIDGLIFGLASGIAMILSMAIITLLLGESPAALLERFSAGELTSPLQGLLSHLAVSAIYGMLFGALIWPVLRRFASSQFLIWLGGMGYGALLLFLAQVAILPGTTSTLAQLPFWEWALGHGIYGLVLGGLFTRKAI